MGKFLASRFSNQGSIPGYCTWHCLSLAAWNGVRVPVSTWSGGPCSVSSGGPRVPVSSGACVLRLERVSSGVCPVCGASYAHRRTLLEHMKKHSGKTTCPVCQQTFSMASNLRRHMVKMHGMARAEVDRITKDALNIR